ncbi:MAG: hypothetical protein J6C18_10815 [Bacteroidaceae bacterium]|nr:hypothetical protein [Bacteroidaceae bacterium]
MQVSLFNGFADKNPKPITIHEVVEIIRADQRLQVLTENHRRYRAAGDTARAEAEKQHMPCYSVAVLFSGGKQQKYIVGYTGMSIVDLDHIPAERMGEVLAMVRNDPHTLLAYTTISGEGVRVLARYALNTFNDNDNVNDNCYPLRSVSQCSTSLVPLKGRQCSIDSSIAERDSAESAEYRTNQKELSPFKGDERRERSDGAEGVKQCAEQYKISFVAINEYYKRLTGCDYDEKCKNATRISGMAHDPEVYYNPDAVPIVVDMTKKPVGRPRRGKSEEVRVKRCEAAVLRELERRGVVYEAGNHNKYISDACYMMNRYGVPESECLEWALDRFSDYQAEGNDVTSIVRSCYLQTEEHGTERPPKAEKESRYASIKDIQEWLTENNIRIRHNVITRKREISFNDNDNVNDNCRPDGWSTSALSSTLIWKELEDKSVNSLYCRFCLDTGRQAKISDLYIIIESDFYPEYHPMRDFLGSLPTWDGVTDHIDALASRVHVTGCTQELHNRFFKKWMVAMVAAWIVDGVTNHEILTYIGPQGIYKSTFMRLLLPPELRGYYSARNFANRMTKDDRLELTEMGLIALEELDHMKLHELNQLKAITTDPTVNERAAYARYRERREHIASFCGTGNNAHFLTDLTSNRRWLPFMVDSIDSPYDTPIDYVGLYAQAYTLWQQGFRYWFDEEENAELELHNRNFEEPNLELELIQTYFRPPGENEVGEFYTASRIIETICVSVKTPLYPRNIAIWMNKLGYRQRRRDNMRGWNVILLTATDIKQRQQENARLSTPE